MRKFVRVTLAAAGVCIVAGLGLSLAGFVMGGEPGYWIGRNGLYTNRQMRELNAEKLAKLEKTEIDPVTSMDVRVSYGDIAVKPSEDDSYYLEYGLYVRNQEPEYSVENGKLTFTYIPEPSSNQTWGQIGFMVVNNGNVHEEGVLTIYVPENAPLDTVKLYTSGSEVAYEGPDAQTLDITSKYGSMKLENIKAETVILTASDGTIDCSDGTFTTLNITNKYGETNLSRIDSERLDIEASDSRIQMRGIVSKSVSVVNKYGSTDISEITADSLSLRHSDGWCDIRKADMKKGEFENKYGDITLELTGTEKEYNYDLAMKYGEITLNDRSLEEQNLRENNGADKDITMSASDGTMWIMTR